MNHLNADLFPEVQGCPKPTQDVLCLLPAGRAEVAAREVVFEQPPLAPGDRNLLKIVTGFRRGLLGGGPPDKKCFMVCAALQGFLGARGVSTDLEEIVFAWAGEEFTQSHYFLRREDGTIIEPTGSQFNGRGAELPPVYIGPMPAVYLRWRTLDSEKKTRGRAAKRPRPRRASKVAND